MIICPHCKFVIADPDLPSSLQIEPGMICPVCLTDMSTPPQVVVTSAQVFVKYVGAFLAGGTFGLLGRGLVMSVFGDPTFLSDLPSVVWLLPSILLMFAIGSFVGSWLEATRSHAVRWLILSIPFLAALSVWLLLFTSSP